MSNFIKPDNRSLCRYNPWRLFISMLEAIVEPCALMNQRKDPRYVVLIDKKTLKKDKTMKKCP